ncbi:hypothetical protein ACLF3G_11940 [Falsiroseomonas sp. HC035]|uniref:hypothetical protein n=1 Tax=Falsiroseomonas sp. HC035 TaxID=3390999 RepID=UPI003D3194D0
MNHDMMRVALLALGAAALLPGVARAQAQATQVTCTYAVTATNSSTRAMGARYTVRFALHQNGTVQQYNPQTQQWTRWNVQTFTPQRVAMTSPSATAGCNMAANMDRNSGAYRLSLRCTDRTAVDYQGSCARATTAPAPAQRF